MNIQNTAGVPAAGNLRAHVLQINGIALAPIEGEDYFGRFSSETREIGFIHQPDELRALGFSDPQGGLPRKAAGHGKRHDNVLQVTRQRMADAGNWGVLNFKETPDTKSQTLAQSSLIPSEIDDGPLVLTTNN